MTITLEPVSYTHLDVYKRQEKQRKRRTKREKGGEGEGERVRQTDRKTWSR